MTGAATVKYGQKHNSLKPLKLKWRSLDQWRLNKYKCAHMEAFRCVLTGRLQTLNCTFGFSGMSCKTKVTSALYSVNLITTGIWKWRCKNAEHLKWRYCYYFLGHKTTENNFSCFLLYGDHLIRFTRGWDRWLGFGH